MAGTRNSRSAIASCGSSGRSDTARYRMQDNGVARYAEQVPALGRAGMLFVGMGLVTLMLNRMVRRRARHSGSTLVIRIGLDLVLLPVVTLVAIGLGAIVALATGRDLVTGVLGGLRTGVILGGGALLLSLLEALLQANASTKD